jgi:hypothetical protein
VDEYSLAQQRQEWAIKQVPQLKERYPSADEELLRTYAQHYLVWLEPDADSHARSYEEWLAYWTKDDLKTQQITERVKMSNSHANLNPPAIISVSGGNPVIQGVKLAPDGNMSIFLDNFKPQRNFSLEPHRRGDVRYFASKRLPVLSFDKFVTFLYAAIGDVQQGQEMNELMKSLKLDAPKDLADLVRRTDKAATEKREAVWCDGRRYRYIVPLQYCIAWSERDGLGVSYVSPDSLTTSNSRKLSLMTLRIEQFAVAADKISSSTQSGCYPDWVEDPLE